MRVVHTLVRVESTEVGAKPLTGPFMAQECAVARHPSLQLQDSGIISIGRDRNSLTLIRGEAVPRGVRVPGRARDVREPRGQILKATQERVDEAKI